LGQHWVNFGIVGAKAQIGGALATPHIRENPMLIWQLKDELRPLDILPHPEKALFVVGRI